MRIFMLIFTFILAVVMGTMGFSALDEGRTGLAVYYFILWLVNMISFTVYLSMDDR